MQTRSGRLTALPPVPDRTGMAVTSLVLGLVGMFIWPLGFPAAMFGLIATKTEYKRKPVGYGMGIAGMVLGFIDLGILIVAVFGIYAHYRMNGQ